MQRFTPGELAVMRILWEHGELKPPEIREHFPREIKDPALRSYLAVLLEKGHVTRRRKGRAYYYRARTPRESAFRQNLKRLVDAFCEGSTEALLVRLIRAERLSEEELIELKRAAEQEKQARGRQGRADDA
jgi:BlaI family penicillinase repressor